MASGSIQRLPRNVDSPLERAADTTDTKSKILDAAEELFMEHGFEATSLRLITTAATVNLAAVNYHFGSKEELFQAVLTRRLDPMNRDRMQLLSSYEARAGPRAGGQEFPAPAWPRLCRSGAVHPRIPVASI